MTTVESGLTTAALFDRYAAALLRYCARRVGTDLAEDIAGALAGLPA